MIRSYLGVRLSALLFAFTSRGLPRTVLVIILLVLWSWLCFIVGRTLQFQSDSKLQIAVHQLALRNGHQSHNTDALAELAAIGRHLELSRQTAVQVKIHLLEKEQEIEHLNESIYFYRKVMAPEEVQGRHGVAIFAINVDKTGQKGRFPIELVLRRTGKKTSFLKGKVAFTVAGFDTETRVASAFQNAYEGEKNFSFKYFQRLRGVLTLPADFQPNKLDLTIDMGRNRNAHETFVWSELGES